MSRCCHVSLLCLGWLAGCGETALRDPTQPRIPDHEPTLVSPGVTVLLKLADLTSFGTDGTSSTSTHAQATFFAPTADFVLLDHALEQCGTDTSKREAIRTGGMEENVGDTVHLTGGSGEHPLPLNPAHARYEATWPPGSAGSPWRPGLWLNLEARAAAPARVIAEAAYVPTVPLRITTPAPGEAINLASDLALTWNAAPETAAAFVQLNLGAHSVMCVTADDGQATLSAAELALLPDDPGNPSLTVHRYRSWRLERLDEVVHLLVLESTVNYLTRL